MTRPDRISREAAEHLAIQALGYLASNAERLGRFLALSGLGPESIRAAAQDRAFLTGVLEYIVSDETLLVGYAEHAGIAPEQVAGVHAALAGQSWERDTA